MTFAVMVSGGTRRGASRARIRIIRHVTDERADVRLIAAFAAPGVGEMI